ncbi:hypothetical protein ASF84_16465 [Pseudomonas sp. Leaf127]|uniref:hypothetical protein n=1 Tax=Pseudomonas sp. Leaf127 TaxID=1736267 RepID=UPI0007027CCF|nr:hypothetical protein [Pseudomonas sp. Leaf127]KQQ54906.1 hypothetical protein ASF84_16465 [Pseudomonas sp. Leaf127]
MARPIVCSIKPIAIALMIPLGIYGRAPMAAPQTDQPAAAAVPLSASAPAAVATQAELYQQAIGNSQFKVNRLELKNNGYTAESGKLVSALGEEEGALIMVRAPGGDVTGLVSRAGRTGLLRTNANGEPTVAYDPEYDWLKHDFVVEDEVVSESSPSGMSDRYTEIDFLMGFTQAALDQYGGDPQAYALLQLESVQASLVNSGLGHIHPILAGIRIYEENIPTTPDGLNRWRVLLREVRGDYQHDMNAGYSLGGDAAGWAGVPDDTSVNDIRHVAAFKHELGHNVGGSHCNSEGTDNYRFGYDAGDNVRSNLCGNNLFYYSGPDVTANGRVLGNARTADMKRLWREQLNRMSNYSPAFSGYRLIHVGNDSTLILDASRSAAYMALDPDIGPTEPQGYSSGPYTELKVPLTRAADGQVHRVVLRGYCEAEDRDLVTMNNINRCGRDGQATLRLSFRTVDNKTLPEGWYNGTLNLKVRRSLSVTPVLVSVSVKR